MKAQSLYVILHQYFRTSFQEIREIRFSAFQKYEQLVDLKWLDFGQQYEQDVLDEIER